MILWNRFGFTEVYSAYNKEKAKLLMEKCAPDLILCDVTQEADEWFTLLTWARENFQQVEIVLTSVRLDEKYFRQALHLGVLDYMEKPLNEEEITDTLMLFQKRIQMKLDAEQEIQGGKYWKQNHALIQEMFWKNLCLNRIPGGLEMIEEEANRVDAGLDMDARYVLILIAIRNQDEMWSTWSEDLCQAAIQNLARAIVKKPGGGSKVMIIYSRVAVLLEEGEFETAREKCHTLVEECEKELGADVFCYISEPVFCEKIADVYTGLLAYSNDDVLRPQQVVDVKNRKMEENRRIIIPKLWSDIFYTANPLTLVQEVRTFLTDLAKEGKLSEANFRIFQQDMLQLFFTYMEKKELSAHELYDNSEIYKLYKAAISSIDDMCCWVLTCTEYITKGISDKNENSNRMMVALVKEYIWQNMKEEISMKQIADHVHLSSDYMTKLFKKETGLTIKEYMIKKRMERARELLQSSEKTVSDIALEVGYDNLSYFIRQFRGFYGVTPKQYQMQRR